MGTKVMALVVVMGAAGAAPAEAQIGDRAGRATGTVVPRDRDVRTYEHCWDERDDRRRDRDVRCEDGLRSGTAYGRIDRYDERDARTDARRDARVWRVYRAHDELHYRLNRMHADWHRRHGWDARGRNARWRREHAELHRRLDRMHASWHREAGWRADHRDARWDRRY